jgi:neutral amino acid transport system ATP-binding protein
MTAVLEVHDLAKAFGGIKALAGCSLSVDEGAIGGLIGPNGSGKTTVFNVVTGYERAHAGEVLLDGKPITGLRPDRIFAAGVGRTFQLTRIFERLTPLENLLVATQRAERWSRGMLRRPSSAGEQRDAYGMLDWVGLSKKGTMPAGQLSYGQRKLLEIAMVLMSDPRVILLDEPAGGVNPTVINELSQRIADLNRQGRTFLIVEHNMEFVMGLCTQVTVMNQGATVVTGTPAEVRADPRVLEAYLGADFDEAADGDE